MTESAWPSSGKRRCVADRQCAGHAFPAPVRRRPSDLGEHRAGLKALIQASKSSASFFQFLISCFDAPVDASPVTISIVNQLP